jgi:beta-glucanase (GH16 family)
MLTSPARGAVPTPRPVLRPTWRSLALLLTLPLTAGWAAPEGGMMEIAAANAPAATAATVPNGPPDRITDAILAKWPRMLQEDWSAGLKIAGRDPGGRWSRTMSNGTKWHKEHGEKQVFTYPGQNGQKFDPFSIVQHDGKRWLRITARATPAGELKAAFKQPIQSGVLANYKTFGITYGYVEARVILPDVKGAWPAFWLLSNDNKWPPEIDVFEHLNPASGKEGGINKVHLNTHWWRKASKGHTARGGYVDLPNGGKVTDAHLYGVLWTKDYIAHYIDRQRVMVTPNPGTEPGVVEGVHKPMHLIFNLAMGGQWPGPVDMSKLPAHMDVTDIGVWGLPETRR